MDFIFYLFIFLFGLIVGSFLNVVICRLETGETIVSGRSHCPRCGHILAWHDLIPVVNFLALGGRCRYCGKSISIQYPLVEFFTGILFVMVVSRYSIYVRQPADTIYDLFIISSLIVIFVYDLKYYIIPDKIVYPAIFVSGIWYFVSGIFLNPYAKYDILNTVFAAFLAGGFFLAIVILTHGKGMGGGDAKLAFLMGLILGWPKVLAALFLAFTAGAIYGIILIMMDKKTLKSEVPFGPFLVAGTIAVVLWGEEIVRWYAMRLI